MNEYLADYYEKLHLKGNVEANIANKNLKEAAKLKSELAGKLEKIEESIKTMEH